MLLRAVLSMETLQLAGEGAKNKQERTNYEKKTCDLYNSLVTPNFKTGCYLWGEGGKKRSGAKFPRFEATLNEFNR